MINPSPILGTNALIQFRGLNFQLNYSAYSPITYEQQKIKPKNRLKFSTRFVCAWTWSLMHCLLTWQ